MEIKDLISNKGEIIEGPKLILPKIFKDKRGFFYESWNQFNFDKLVEKTSFVQDNHSKSNLGVLRGLHYQIEPFAQDKLVRCTSGKVYDVIVDLRFNSFTYGQWAYIELNSEENNQVWIPKGFAHGFLSLTNSAEVQYKASNLWSKKHERTIIWNDETIKIKWPIHYFKEFNLSISTKDSNGMTLKYAEETKNIFL